MRYFKTLSSSLPMLSGSKLMILALITWSITLNLAKKKKTGLTVKKLD